MSRFEFQKIFAICHWTWEIGWIWYFLKKSGDKTISVLVTRQTTHPVYKKIIRVSKKYLAHDSDNKITVGESVKIQETRPISKNKSWEIIK